MQDEAFERRVAALMREEHLPEPIAREKVCVEAGEGGDVRIEGAEPVDPRKDVESLGDSWKPRP